MKVGSWFTRRATSASVASLVLALLARSAAAAPADVTVRIAPPPADHSGEEASDHFKRGLQLFDEGDYTLALVEFERAYQLAPNYRALYNIALVDVQLGRYADAARTFEDYLRDGGDAIAPARRAEVAKTLTALELRTASVDISTNVPNAEVTLDGKALDLPNLHGPMVIDAGEHVVQATAPGYRATNRAITLAGADHMAVRLDLVPLAPQHLANEAPARGHVAFVPGFVGAGALAAGAIVSGVVMLDARSHLTDLQNTPGSDAGQRQSAAARINAAALTADIFSGLAIVATGISIYLSVGPEHSQKRSPSVAIAPQRVSLSLPF
ncbi:MAG: tetratricopeptide repeat protein [Myxococcota bacterium]|nr:tetratricopeptide repeat protein [Myxococcota bacterium]